MRKVAKAAKFLSQFRMLNVTQCEFTVYIAYGDGCLEGIGCDYNPPCKSVLSCYADFRSWTPQQYAGYITNPEKRSHDCKDAEVVAIVVNFEVPGSTDLYVLECTNFTTMNRFDRLIVENNYKKSIEVYLTQKESQALHGAADVVKLIGKISTERYNPNYAGDIPIVVKDHKARRSSDSFA